MTMNAEEAARLLGDPPARAPKDSLDEADALFADDEADAGEAPAERAPVDVADLPAP